MAYGLVVEDDRFQTLELIETFKIFMDGRLQSLSIEEALHNRQQNVPIVGGFKNHRVQFS